MGLGSARSEWDDFEWFALHADSDDAPPLWPDDVAVRVLLCDLDNMRADPRRLAERMRVAVALAREADVSAFAGQSDSVSRCVGLLEEFRDQAMAVGPGRNAADHALLASADRITGRHVQFVVMSNDGIFARLALRGDLTIVSPSPPEASIRLVRAARVMFDVRDLVSHELEPAVA